MPPPRAISISSRRRRPLLPEIQTVVVHLGITPLYRCERRQLVEAKIWLHSGLSSTFSKFTKFTKFTGGVSGFYWPRRPLKYQPNGPIRIFTRAGIGLCVSTRLARRILQFFLLWRVATWTSLLVDGKELCTTICALP